MVLPLGDLEKTHIVPVVTYGLIALNVVMFLCRLEHGMPFTTSYAATPLEISRNIDLPRAGEEEEGRPPEDPERSRRLMEQEHIPFPVWMTIFTAMFLHGSPLHLAGNMLYLWIFGDNVEEVLGPWRYLAAYLACGVAGTVLQVVANPDSRIPILGASGAIAGVMGAYVVWFPQNQVRVLVFRFITQMPALLVVGGWILLQIGEGVGSVRWLGETGGVAYLAHIGGAASGILVAVAFTDRARAILARNEAQDGWFMGP